MFTLRHTGLFIASLFNLAAAIFSLIAFFKTFPVIACLYFFVSVPITIYLMLAKKNKVLDTDILDSFVSHSLNENPF